MKRFWDKVDKSGDCWNWTASFGSVGYGQFKLGESPIGAHRASYLLNVGEIPGGLYVCHHCDNKACVNPDHLFLGTASDNMNDMYSKDRCSRIGEKNGRAKLLPDDVRLIRRLLDCKTVQEIADMFDLSRGAVTAIKSGDNWSHI